MAAEAMLDAAFHALSHPTRRAMLALLATGERTVGELAEPFEVSLAASSKHVKVLEDAALVVRRVEGRVHTLSLNPAPLVEVVDATDQVRETWEANFRRLDAVLEEIGRKRGRRPKSTTPRRRKR